VHGSLDDDDDVLPEEEEVVARPFDARKALENFIWKALQGDSPAVSEPGRAGPGGSPGLDPGGGF
jgi:hypothetical protein